MKRSFTLLLTAMLLIGVISGCGSKQDSTPDKETTTKSDSGTAQSEGQPDNTDTNSDAAKQDADNSDSRTDADVRTSIYEPILSQYRAAITNQFYRDILDGNSDAWDSIGADVNTELLSNSRNFDSYFVYYALEDIDQNGTPELLIGGSDGINPVTNYDVFCFDGEQPVHLFSDFLFGYRTNFRLLSDGIFMVSWSGSAFESGYEFYRISADGYSPELVESISIHDRPESSLDALRFYHDTEGTSANEITKEEFDQILSQYQNTPAMELSWTELSAS